MVTSGEMSLEQTHLEHEKNLVRWTVGDNRMSESRGQKLSMLGVVEVLGLTPVSGGLCPQMKLAKEARATSGQTVAMGRNFSGRCGAMEVAGRF